MAYPGRTPHIHIKVSVKDKPLLTTQLYIKGEPRNERDGLLRRVEGADKRAALMADFKPMKDSETNELEAKFDMVLGYTPPDPEHADE